MLDIERICGPSFRQRMERAIDAQSEQIKARHAEWAAGVAKAEGDALTAAERHVKAWHDRNPLPTQAEILRRHFAHLKPPSPTA